MTQERKSARAFSNTFVDVDDRIKIPGFGPKQLSLSDCAGIMLEYRQASNGVGQFERWGLLVTAVQSKGLVVVGFGDLGTPLRSVNVSEMSKRVSKLAIVTLRAIDGDSLFIIMLPRGIQVMQVSLNLTQGCECGCQLHLVVSRATQINNVDQIIFGVLNPALSSCLKGMGQQFIGNLRHRGHKIITEFLAGAVAGRRFLCGGFLLARFGGNQFVGLANQGFEFAGGQHT